MARVLAQSRRHGSVQEPPAHRVHGLARPARQGDAQRAGRQFVEALAHDRAVGGDVQDPVGPQSADETLRRVEVVLVEELGREIGGDRLPAECVGECLHQA